jgi:hypothetical protein
MTQMICNGHNKSGIMNLEATRYVPAKWVASPSKLVKMMVENVGEENFRVEVSSEKESHLPSGAISSILTPL